MPGQVRSIAIRFLAEVGNYVQGVQRMKAATGDLVTELSKSEQQRQNFQRLGTGMLVAGAGIAAGIGLATRAAVQWESAWAGVAKTVDGTEAELAALEEDLRGLARELPATHGEIAAVAEAAGQLGVATEDITDFTRVMINLGEATNLTADEAATSIAQLMNVMGTAPDQVDELGAALVELGNNGASTEREIVMMAQRIAGAGSIVGATEADVLALANALASAGIEVEAGGSAISRVMVDIATAVNEGGEKMDTFATVAGQSSDEFAEAWRQDPVAALNLFIQGLGRMNAAGGDVFGTLDDLGLSGIRTRDALLRLSSSGDLLTQSLADGARAWDENVALTQEAERRYGTVEARLQIARNQVNDFAIDMGQTFLPVLGAAADKVGAFVEVLAEMPGPMKTALGILAALTAGVLLLGGTLFTVLPRIAATKAALDQLAAAGGRTAAAVGLLRGSMSFLMGPWGIAIAAAAAVATGAFAVWTSQQADARREAQEIADTLDELTGGFTDATRALVAYRLEEEGALSAAQRLGLDLNELVDIALSGEDAIRRLEAAIISASDGEIAFHEGGLVMNATAEKSFEDISKVQGIIAALNPELAAGREMWERNAEATGTAGDAMAEVDPAARGAAESLGLTAQQAQEAADAADELDEELRGLLDMLFGVEEAEDAAARAMREVIEHAREQGAALEGNSEAALNNRDNIRDLIEADFDLIAAMAEAGATSEELRGATETLRQKFVDQMRQAGFSEEAIERYAAAYDEVPSAVDTKITQSGVHSSLAQIDNLVRAIGNIDRNVVINYSTSPVGPIFGPAIPRRHGGITEDGVIRAQHGVLRQPQVFTTRSPARFAFAEPATGGEAFIPRLGDRGRSLAIADHAAQWHGGRVVADDGAALGGRWQWHGMRGAGASAGAGGGGGTFTGNLYLNDGTFLGKVEGVVDAAMDTRDRAQLRALRQGVGADS